MSTSAVAQQPTGERVGQRYKDLRTYIAELEAAGEVKRITAPVNWDGEVGEIARAVFKRKGPALIFECVKDSKIPLFTGALATPARFGMMFDCGAGVREQVDYLTQVLNTLVRPRIVERGACQENVLLGSDIDVTMFPSPKWHPKDGGRYIGTLGSIVTKDPDTGIRNVAIFRSMVEGANKIGFNCEQHNGIHLRKYRDRRKPMEFAMSIGSPPAVVLASVAKLAYGIDEYETAGGIAGEPIPLVKCKTVNLEVPADAEIVIEGFVSPDPATWELEGPFGEFTGHFSSLQPTKKPTGTVTAITFRDKAIFQGTSPGAGSTEGGRIGTMLFTASWRAALLASGIPGVKDLNVLEMGCGGFICVISLSRHFYAGNAQQAMAFLDSLGHHPKITICVDDDIDVFDTDMVLWALGSRVQPHRDVDITKPNHWACPLDPSVPDEIRHMPVVSGSKMMIDATKFFKPGVTFSDLVADSEEAKKRVAARWKELGFTSEY